MDKTIELREYAIKHKFITTILDRLHIISKETKRTFDANYKEEEVKVKVEKEKEKEENKLVKKKGTGYGSGNDNSTTKWATAEKNESNKEISEQLENIFHIVINFLSIPNWRIPKVIVNEFMESCLLPLIENTLRAGTLL